MSKQAPYLSWTSQKNYAMGKLKLQSLERSGIFFDAWVSYKDFEAGLDHQTASPFPLSPYTLNKNSQPKKVDVPAETTLVNGVYKDGFGAQQDRDIAYTVKVFVWVETTDDANGIEYDFQKEQ